MSVEPQFKKKLGFMLSLGLNYDLSFRIQAASYCPQSGVQETGLIFYNNAMNI